MIKSLARHGNSVALVIDKPILQLLEMDSYSRVRVRVDGRRLIVTPLELPELDRKLESLFKNEDFLRRVMREMLPDEKTQ